MYRCSAGQCVLVVWSQAVAEADIKALVVPLRETVGDSGRVATESAHMLVQSNLPSSSYDVALIGLCSPFTLEPSVTFLSEILRVLKPSGQLVVGTRTCDTVVTSLRLSGFSDVTILGDLNLTDEQKAAEATATGGVVKEIKAVKPNFEVGSAMPLSFASRKIDVNDLQDPDDLLSEEDLVKPDASSLKVCGTTGLRKACKNCACGLREELEAEDGSSDATTNGVTTDPSFKSSCGNCYLGDAFRCAACPYAGMPAFRPGDKVKLMDSTLLDAM